MTASAPIKMFEEAIKDKTLLAYLKPYAQSNDLGHFAFEATPRLLSVVYAPIGDNVDKLQEIFDHLGYYTVNKGTIYPEREEVNERPHNPRLRVWVEKIYAQLQ